MPKNQQLPKDHPDYQPTKAELEADVSIPTTPDELLRAVMGHAPRRRPPAAPPRPAAQPGPPKPE